MPTNISGADFTTGADWALFQLSGSDIGSYVATLTFGSDATTVINDQETGGGTGGGNTMANPVPAPILLLGTGLVGLAGFRRKKK